MAPPKATPESRRESYGTRGRPLSDWEALKELWYGSETVREASNDAFTRFEKHAYAQPATQREADGRALTELIWAEMRALGYEVETDPVHFVATTEQASAGEAASAGAATPRGPGGSGPPPSRKPAPGGDGGAHANQWVAIGAFIAIVVVVVLFRRRRRGS